MSAEVISSRILEVIRDAYEFFQEQLELQEYSDIMDARFARPGELEEGCYGKCSISHHPKTQQPLKILIILKEIPTAFGMVETLAHEMVHAKQSIVGDVTFERKPVYLLGLFQLGYRVIPLFKGKKTKHLPYFQRPEELEAFNQQSDLCEAFIQQRYLVYNNQLEK